MVDISEKAINNVLTTNAKTDSVKVREVLSKALTLQGLSLDEVAALLVVTENDLLQEIFTAAKTVKEAIYGKRLVIFAPLYVSNVCTNNCVYCGFRAANTALKRRTLSQDEIAAETKLLLAQGHKRILLLAGERNTEKDFQYILDSIATVYKTHEGNSAIRRVNVNIAPLTVEDFRRLKDAEIGTYQLFQETYHKEIYANMHLGGKKTDYAWRIAALDRAMQAGIDDVGMGVLFGLADWRFEILALLQHIEHLVREFNVGPHTISVPRLEPAVGIDFTRIPLNVVNDQDFCKIIAILRLAIPYTGIIMSSRETIEMRRATFELGVSQISAGSRTNPGGYAEDEFVASQFALGDHRSLDEVIRDVANLGYIPSFCTSCYRIGRTGAAFMELAKPGLIKKMCQVNALITFQEYLLYHATTETRIIGEKLIQAELAIMPQEQREKVAKYLAMLQDGQNDIFV